MKNKHQGGVQSITHLDKEKQTFWSFVVAVVLFAWWFILSLRRIYRIQHPQPIENPLLILGIIVLSILLEGSALKVALKESNSTLKNMFLTIKNSSSSHILVVLIEDTGALIGLIILTLGLALSVFVHPIFDGIAKINDRYATYRTF